MLASVSLLLLHATQRPGAPAPTVAIKRVTGAYFRMHDPEFVAQALQNADGPGGRRVALSVLTPDLFANRSSVRPRLAAYRRNVVVGRGAVRRGTTPPAGAANVVIGGNIGSFKPSNGSLDYKDLAPTGLKKSATRSVGIVAKGAAAPTAIFHGTATKSGVIRISTEPNAPFSVTAMRVETGEVTSNGAFGNFAFPYSPGGTVPIVAGQDWTVEVRMNTDTVGVHLGKLVIDDGSSNAFTVRGRVVPAQGELTFWAEKCYEKLAPGSQRTFNLHVQAKGTGPTEVKFTGSSTLKGVKIGGLAPRKLDGTKEVIIPCTVTADVDAEDGSGSLIFAATAYDGKATASVEGGVQLETIWTSTGAITLGSPKARSSSILRFNNSGYWSLTSYQENLSNEKVGTEVVFMFDLDHKYNANLGEMERLGGTIGGTLESKEKKWFERDGNDPNLRAPKYANAQTGRWKMGSGDPKSFVESSMLQSKWREPYNVLALKEE